MADPQGPLPSRSLRDLPRDELTAIAEEFGLEVRASLDDESLVQAIELRRGLIEALNRDAMLDVVRWGRRPVPINASKERLAAEIARIKSMSFEKLSERGLRVLGKLRGVEFDDDTPRSKIEKRLRRQEGIFSRFGRKRRAWVGSVVGKLLGDEPEQPYQFLPPTGESSDAPAGSVEPPGGDLKAELEETGLIGGITNRLRRTADSYLNQKLDEIEARIDRKLDEIDRRLAEWRDKEIANRIRIVKITLWVSVIIAAVSLLYSYIRLYLVG